jgi:hypothetical protein
MPENERGKTANETGKWVRLALVSSAVSLWLIYDMASATETPRQALMITALCPARLRAVRFGRFAGQADLAEMIVPRWIAAGDSC